MTSFVLLVIGYPLALGVLARLKPVLAERRVWWFVVLEGATASITAGWWLHGRLVPAVLNGAALVGFAIAWLVTGQRVGPRASMPADQHAEGGGSSLDGAPDRVLQPDLLASPSEMRHVPATLAQPGPVPTKMVE